MLTCSQPLCPEAGVSVGRQTQACDRRPGRFKKEIVLLANNVSMSLLWGLLLLCVPAAAVNTYSAPLPSALSSKNSVTSPSTPLSAEVQDFLAHPVDKNAFARGLFLIKNRNDSDRSRKLALDKMHGARKLMDAGQLRALRDETTALAKDPQAPPSLSAQAIGVMASANLLLLERGAISLEESKQEAPFLMNVVQDPGRDLEVRGRAIRALSDLKITEAIPVLQQLLSNPANHNHPEVARAGCIALGRLSPDKALPVITNLMSQTREQSVFGSGAFALGQMKTAKAMAALVKLKGRFPSSGSCDAALAEMEDVILAELKTPGAPELSSAILATSQLWKKSQRERYVPLLHGLLKTAPPALRAQVVEQLLTAASALDFAEESRECTVILGLIANQPDLNRYAERIRQRLTARPLAPTGKTIPVPPSANVN